MLHIDFDAFFASLEELRNPSLKGKPVVICQFTKNKTSGVVVTSNYLAREKGIISGMPLYIAKKRAGDAVFLEADKEYYEEKSRRIFEFLSRFGKLEKRSVDEAFLDVPSELAFQIKHEVEKRFGISCSIGIGKNRVLAKIASKLAKPSGIKEIKSIKELKDYEVSLIPNIGERTSKKLNELGIFTIGDLIRVANENKSLLLDNFSSSIREFLFNVVFDKEERVEEVSKKSLGKIITLSSAGDISFLLKELERVVDMLYEKLEGRIFDKVGVFVFFSLTPEQKERKIRRSRQKEDILKVSKDLLKEILENRNPYEVRRIGVFVSITEEKAPSLQEFL